MAPIIEILIGSLFASRSHSIVRGPNDGSMSRDFKSLCGHWKSHGVVPEGKVTVNNDMIENMFFFGNYR